VRAGQLGPGPRWLVRGLRRRGSVLGMRPSSRRQHAAMVSVTARAALPQETARTRRARPSR
jgi:hypothetical protein